MTAAHYDVAIIGGGMVGMSLAIALGREGMRVAVIEQSALPSQLEPTFDGRVSAIALGSKRILDNIGAWAQMAPHAQPINDIRVTEGNTPFFLHYDHDEVRDATGGEPFGHIVENRYIRHALHKAARRHKNISLLDNTAPEGFEREADKVNVILRKAKDLKQQRDSSPSAQNDKIIHCRLLVGADGKNSRVRAMAGIKATEWKYGQTAIVCTIEHEKPHDGLAQERFLPAGPFAVLPMTSLPHRARARVGAGLGNANDNANQVCPPPNLPPTGGGVWRSSLVWVEPDDRVEIYLNLPEKEFVQEITERTGDYLGRISCAGRRFSYPLSLMHANSYTGERLALIGDAAHAIHPIAGQGVNLGFRDVAVLAELAGDAFKKKEDIGANEILAHYQRWRRFDNTAMLMTTDVLNRLFSNNIAPLRAARNLGLWGVSKMPPVKRFFMKHAMGLVGDLPRLTRSSNK